MTVFTCNEMAKAIGVGPWRVRHLLDTRSGFEPVQMVGPIKLYDKKTLRKVAADLAVLDQRRAAVPA